MSSKVLSIGIHKHTKRFSIMFISDPLISSIRAGCKKKNDRNDINSVNDNRVWVCIRVTFSSSIGKAFGLHAD